MTTKEEKNAIQRTARLAGFLYVLHIPLAVFGFFYVHSRLIVPGDAAATASNIVASEGLFRSSIVSWLIGQMIFIVLPLVLYKVLKPVNKTHALLMVIFIELAIPIAFINEVNRLAVLVLLNGADYVKAFQADQLQAQVMFFLDLHAQGIGVAQVFWGLWLFPLGYLIFKSGFLPRILGIIVIIGGFGLLIDSAIFFLFPDSDVRVSQITGLAEIPLGLWLLIKGVNVEQWKKRALESA
ncbi:MAG TPA: DUF4386 domain-containing protein [Pyrinomonadaceae bacterium]|nr:DUF4386 domain-containing protein [Pyrinomonadaceae bacterium]